MAYIVTSVLTTLGYTIALSKSSLLPSQCVRFLGYLSNSLLMAFILPDDKKEKFRVLRETILSRQEVDLQMLQRFARKTTSFSIAVPAARLYKRTVFRAIGFHGKRPNRSIRIAGELREEIVYWRNLDKWQGHLPWFDKLHQLTKISYKISYMKWQFHIWNA